MNVILQLMFAKQLHMKIFGKYFNKTQVPKNCTCLLSSLVQIIFIHLTEKRKCGGLYEKVKIEYSLCPCSYIVAWTIFIFHKNMLYLLSNHIS